LYYYYNSFVYPLFYYGVTSDREKNEKKRGRREESTFIFTRVVEVQRHKAFDILKARVALAQVEKSHHGSR
jgi:hypothetical protein